MVVGERAHLANTQEMLTEKASMIMALYEVTSSLNPPLQPRQSCAAQQAGSKGRKVGTFGEATDLKNLVGSLTYGANGIVNAA